jgi:acyl dehydratase
MSEGTYAVGDVLEGAKYPVTRETLIRYAGASGDFNVIHWNEREAKAVGLPDVIAHGNLTMALGMRYLVERFGDPTAVVEYSVRFARPVVVPDDGVGAEVAIEGRIGAIEDDGTFRVDLTVTSGGQKVLAQPRARVRPAR